MGVLQVLAMCFGLLCLVFLMTKLEESAEIGSQTQWKKTIYLCDYGVGLRTILGPISTFMLPFTYAAELTSLYRAFSFWLLQHGSFTWLKVFFHFKLCLLITPLKKTINTLYGYHKVTAKNRPLDPFIVERKSSYKSMFVLPSGCPLDVNYPAISDSKLSSILPLVARVPRKLKHLFTTPNLVPVNMMSWFSWSPTTYRAHMFKNKVTSDTCTWKVCVVIVRNDPECEEAMKRAFTGYEPVRPFEVMFEGDKIVLKIQKEDIPLSGGLVLDGWSITAENYPEITKKNVDGYCGQGMMPCCRLKVKWKGGDNTELKQLVTLEGAKESSNVFELMCSYEASACAYVFKKKCSADTWIVNVVVVRDYAKCIKAVKDEFQGHDEVGRPFLVEFWRDSIVLKIRKRGHPNHEIPFPEGLDVDGWNITPDNPPVITKESVNRFPDGAIKPFCQLEVKWKGGDNRQLKELVTLEGAKGPRNVFYLMCHYEASPYAYVFKQKQAADTWMVNVVIVRDDKKCQNAVKSEFQGHEEVTVFPVEFEENRVVLKISEGRSPSVDIPYPEGLNRDGWTITPYSPPEITKESVKRFPDYAIKPYCRLEVKWRGGDNLELKQLVTLEGAKGDRNYFNLICNYQGQNHITSLCAYVFKKKRAANTWIMNVVIIRDDKDCTSAMKSEFQDYEEAVPHFLVKFKKDADRMVLKIRSRKEGHPTLEIPYDPDGLVVDGWNITPENPPEITLESVNRYPQASGLMPHCQFTVKWNGADRDLKQVMCLEGAEERRDFFHLMCSYQEIRSLCSVFKKKNAEGSTWMMNIAIFRNDKECVNAVKSEFQDYEEAVQAFPVRFEKERTVLKINRDGEKVDIPQPQGLDVDGWNITPTGHPEITKDCVHSYPDSGQKPFCQLEVKWKGGDNSELKELVYLDGAENFFTLICYHQGSTGPIPGPVVLDKKPQVHELSEVIKRTAANWSELAYALKFDNHDVETIGRNNRNVKDGCTVMLGNWLDGQGERGPRTWRTLLEALRDIDLTELADELSPP